MNSKILFFFHSMIMLFFIFITFVWCIMLFPYHSSAKMVKPKWKKEITSLEIGKTYQYRIKHSPKKAKIRFSSNHTSRASINRKTGLLRAKKNGSVLITAKISQPHKKTKKLKTKILITKKKVTGTNQNKSSALSTKTAEDNHSILNNVHFSVAESINPWNHSIMLYSSRILLQSEVQNTNLALSPLSTKSGTTVDLSLTAHFSSLSADGKTITYQLNADSANKLCPGNGTLDGEYMITSNFFLDTLQTQYHERIKTNSICGIILDSNQSSLSQASVQLYANSQDSQSIPLAVTTTDQNGYYEFQDITEENIRIEASLENYEPYSQSFLHPAGQNICQNIILHPSSSRNLAISCRILDEQNRPMKNTAVILTTEKENFATETTHPTNDKSENFPLQGMVDHNGMVCFTNQESISSVGYSQIEYHANQSTPRYVSAEMPISDSPIYDPLNPLTRNQKYILYVFPNTDGTLIPMDYQMESFSFSFAPLLSDQLFLQIHLQNLSLLSTEKVSINADTLTNPISSFQYSLYDKTGKELFQSTFFPLPKDRENDYSQQLNTALQNHKVRLPDGNYYAAITAYHNTYPTSGTTILPVEIFNSVISSVNFTLSPCQTFRSLVFTDYQDEPLEKMSFILYQRSDTIYFPIGTYTTDPFTSVYTGQRAYLNLPVLTGISYNLISTNPKYKVSTGASFQVSVEQNNLPFSNIPNHQILFDRISDDEYTTENELDLSGLLDYVAFCTNNTSFSADFFSHSITYPNTVYAYYQTDGTFTTLLFATPAFSSLDNLSSTLICNQLQNGMKIQTSQKSYSTTPFFVT